MRRPTAAASADQFAREVFPAELEEIRARRRAAGLGPLPGAAGPSPALGLIGLALSGEGIRSATFSLGVIQGLARHGILRAVDYLSTVSGGGFIGGALSSLLNHPGAEPDGPSFPLRHVAGQPDPPAVRHLRNSPHYLAPGGLDRLRIPALLLQGIVLNFLTIVPYVMLLAGVTEIAYAFGQSPRRSFLALPLLALAVFAAVVVAYPFVARLAGRWMTWSDRNRYERFTALAFFVAAASLLLMPLFALVDETVWMIPGDLVQLLRGGLDRLWRLLPAALGAVAAWALAGRWAAGRRIRSLAGLYAVGLLGPALPVGLYLVLCVLVIDPPGTMGIAMDMRRPAAVEETAALNDERIPETLVGLLMWTAANESVSPATVSAAAEVLVIDENRHWHVVTDGQHFMLTATPALRFWLEAPHGDRVALVGNLERSFLVLAIGWWLLAVLFMNVNASSLHRFYRDRLSRAYLIQRAPGEAEAFEASDEVTLSDLNRPGTRAPYHLVNASLNLNGAADADVRGRSCDFFLFSKRYTGSPRVGYAPTPELERLHPYLDLGTAVAISGAAASPDAGVAAVAPVAFVLTLLDVRAGYWLPSPAAVLDAGGWRRLRLRLGTGPSYLIREAFQQVGSGGPFVNLSDGGQVENLAIYELLRRRCRVIIAVDGTQDPGMRFDGLMQLALYARSDLGADIEIDVSAVRRAASGWSSLHYAIGTIAYGAAPDGSRETGVLLYLKASLTGDEDEFMREYHGAHPDFPHEPTADRSFTDRQWEMYRRLGLHVVESALTNASDPYMRSVRDLLGSLRAPVPGGAGSS